MTSKITWTCSGVSHGSGQTSATLFCNACRKAYPVQASTAAGAFIRLQMTWCTHVFEEHKEEPTVQEVSADGQSFVARPATVQADALARCGQRGYMANSLMCHYERGHEGPCGWDS